MSKTPAPGTPAPSPPPPGPSGPTPTGPGPQRARGTGSPWPSRPQTPTSPSGPGRADDLMALANAVFELSPSEDDRAGGADITSGAVSESFSLPATPVVRPFGTAPVPRPTGPVNPTGPTQPPPPLRERVSRMREPIRLGEGPPYDFLARS